ncbi:hypothetical protein VB779_13070 [Haloarculaceae archaeon H-GB11]|nr:hypothetical protein [Haloarculaceae archaeon H-GB11]
MHRRQYLSTTAAVASLSLAGCSNAALRNGTTDHSTDGDAETDACAATTETGGPQSAVDALTLFEVPSYVTEYADTVVVAYDTLDAAARSAVERALAADGTYRECSREATAAT